MKKVYICSRYRADADHTTAQNIERALYACTYALIRGYAPFAPHLIYPRCLDDDDPREREQGMKAGQAFLAECDELWQWGASVSEGMAAEIALARELCIPTRVFNGIGIPKQQWNSEKQLREEGQGGCSTTEE